MSTKQPTCVSRAILFTSIFALVTSVSVSSGAPGSERALWIHYHLDRASYLVAEPIFLTIWVENYGNETEYYDINDFWDFDLRDEMGKPVRFVGLPVETRAKELGLRGKGVKSRGTPIRPHEVDRGGSCRNLLDYYGEGQWGQDSYLKAGTYRITVKGLKSDTVYVRVMPPSSSEDSAAASVLVYAADNAFTVFNTPEARIKFFADFVEKFPSSIYTPRALRHLLGVSQHYARSMLMHFPESGFAWQALLHLDPSVVPSEERAAVLEGLQKLRSQLESEDLLQKADSLMEKLRR